MTCAARKIHTLQKYNANDHGESREIIVETWCGDVNGIAHLPEGRFSRERQGLDTDEMVAVIAAHSWTGPRQLATFCLVPWDPDVDCSNCRRAVLEGLVRRDEKLAAGTLP